MLEIVAGILAFVYRHDIVSLQPHTFHHFLLNVQFRFQLMYKTLVRFYYQKNHYCINRVKIFKLYILYHYMDMHCRKTSRISIIM